MLIVCPSCATAYRIELPTLGDNGRSVRCARCREVWFASAASAVPESHEAPAQAVSQARAEASARPAPPGEVSDDAGDLGLADWSSADLAGDAPASEATESVTVTDGPSLVPSLEQSDAAAGPDGTIIAAQGEDIETIAARRERVTHPTRKGSRL